MHFIDIKSKYGSNSKSLFYINNSCTITSMWWTFKLYDQYGLNQTLSLASVYCLHGQKGRAGKWAAWPPLWITVPGNQPFHSVLPSNKVLYSECCKSQPAVMMYGQANVQIPIFFCHLKPVTACIGTVS